MMRLDFGKKANRNEHSFAIGCFVIFTFFCLIIYGYFGFLTTYVLIIDMGLSYFGAFFTFFEMIAGLDAWCRFKDLLCYSDEKKMA